MIDKERLEDIKKELELDWSDISYVVNQDDVKWLINRVEELELEINDWRAEVQKWQKFYKESEESHLETKELLYSTISEIKRYKQSGRITSNMITISETVNQYYFGFTKVVKTVEEDEQGYLIHTKKVYVAGIKVFQSSTCRKRSIKDSVMQVWGGELK